MSGPLEGYRIIDLTAIAAGPFATMMLGDQGADVIKVEPPGIGDVMRFLGTSRGGLSVLWANCNRSKRSIALNLRDERGRKILLDLVAGADVFIQNYRPGVAKRLGIGEEDLREAYQLQRSHGGSLQQALLGAGMLTRDIYKRFINPGVAHSGQKFFGRIGVVIITALALVVATTAQDALVLLGGLAVAYGFQMWPALIGICWWKFLTRKGIIVGLIAGIIAVTLTESIGQQWFGITAWGRLYDEGALLRLGLELERVAGMGGTRPATS